MLLANNIINDALALIGYISFGEAPEADASQLAARTLQGMIADFAIQEDLNPKIQTVNIPAPFDQLNGQWLTVGSADPTNDLPFDISDLITVKLQFGNVTYNLNQISYAEYQALSIKNVQSIPTYFAFDFQEPQGKIYFHMAAMQGLTATVIFRPKLTQIVNNQTTILLDNYWQECLTYNLAARLYPFLPGPTGLDSQIIYMAKSTVAHIRQRNAKMNMKKARPGYFSGENTSSSYWLSPLNTVNQ